MASVFACHGTVRFRPDGTEYEIDLVNSTQVRE